MVVFICNKCNESLKKKNVENHFHTCRCATVSCVDCSKDFTKQTYVAHISCITEQEKYGKVTVESKTPKGAAKQMDWTAVVQSRLAKFTPTPGIQLQMKKKILESNNVPRKKAKFENFLTSCFRFARADDINAIWLHITKPEAEQVDSSFLNKTKDASQSSISCGIVRHGKRKLDDTGDESSICSPLPKKPLEDKPINNGGDEQNGINNNMSLKEVMASHLNEHKGPMKIKKLRRKTFRTFRLSTHFDESAHTEEALERLFQKALKKKRLFSISEDNLRVSITDNSVQED
uniref:Zf-LYAR domain-containing protein n=1 Tax=Mesocestoides corti TaxID=53468 RepID=A0A5K3ET70_MESCO